MGDSDIFCLGIKTLPVNHAHQEAIFQYVYRPCFEMFAACFESTCSSALELALKDDQNGTLHAFMDELEGDKLRGL